MKSFGEYIQLIQEVGNRPYKWKKEPSGGQAGSVWEAVFVTNNKQKYYFIKKLYNNQKVFEKYKK